MKKFLLPSLTLALCLMVTPSLCAQENNTLLPAPVKTLVSEPQRDILREQLNNVKKLEILSTINTKDKTKNKTSNDTESTIFRNPFIPQVPFTATKIIQEEKEIQQPIPTAAQEEPIPQFIVSGYVWNSKKPTAIINGKIVTLLDQISNWTISEITKEGVRVSYQEQSLWIKPIVNPDAGQQNQQTVPYRR